MKPHCFATLAPMGRYRLLRGEIDLEMIVIMVVTSAILFGIAIWFLKC